MIIGMWVVVTPALLVGRHINRFGHLDGMTMLTMKRSWGAADCDGRPKSDNGGLARDRCEFEVKKYEQFTGSAWRGTRDMLRLTNHGFVFVGPLLWYQKLELKAGRPFSHKN